MSNHPTDPRTPPHVPMIDKLVDMGYVKGVRVRDWMGMEGVITDPGEWGRGVYSYVIKFTNEHGFEVYLTNGVVFATKLA